jgi:cellulose synthase/poly-beta-1,6-N-acetylglucosamine synthase-like glycosyltransferase
MVSGMKVAAPSDGSLRPELPKRELVAVVPAYNEEEHIGATVESLLRQTRPVDPIVVVADNCTDRTVSIARSYEGVEVIETVGNSARKAGALNQGLEHVGRGYDSVLQMDADTELDECFVEEAVGELEADPELGGVCSRFFAKETTGIVRLLQAMEYVRYDYVRYFRQGKVSVLSGTGVVFRTSALPEGKPWDEESLVEDFALTLSLKPRGWKVKAGDRAIVYTDTMPTVGALWRQRLRWLRGHVRRAAPRGLADLHAPGHTHAVPVGGRSPPWARARRRCSSSPGSIGLRAASARPPSCWSARGARAGTSSRSTSGSTSPRRPGGGSQTPS